MKRLLLVLSVAMALSACSTTPAKSPDVTDAIKQSLAAASLKDVSVSQDRTKGVVTLGGHVPNASEKEQAELIAKTQAPGQVVANEIAVLPPGIESDQKAVNSDLDKGIEKNLDAALIAHGMKQQDVSYAVKNGVVTLSGSVASQQLRSDVERLASGVPYVRQVVNTLQVKNQKATSRGGGD
jgi:osmotically-inducible protein OsmY